MVAHGNPTNFFKLVNPRHKTKSNHTQSSQTRKQHSNVSFQLPNHFKMTVNSRILQSSHNHLMLSTLPQHFDECTMQTTKPKLNILKSNSQSRIQLQLSSDNSSWPVVEKVNSSLSSESETDAVIQSIFRRRVDPLEGQDEHDMFTLKRANPVYDSDDEEEEFMSSPAKRQRKAGTMSLHVDEELPESADVDFSLFFRSS